MLYSANVKEPIIFWGIVDDYLVGTGIVKVNGADFKIESLHGTSEQVVLRRFIRDKPNYYGVVYPSYDAAYEDAEFLHDT